MYLATVCHFESEGSSIPTRVELQLWIMSLGNVPQFPHLLSASWP